jgi:hypothetical protein
MGLDMYLYRFQFVPSKITILPDGTIDIPTPPQKMTYDENPWADSGEKNEYGEPVGPYDKSEEVAYWRKANHIHNWFVQNCAKGEDECDYRRVTVDQLRDLRDVCQRVKDESILVPGQVTAGHMLSDGGWEPIIQEGLTIANPEVAERLLPTAEGFFFGSYEYNQWYMNKVDETITQIDKILESVGEFDEFYYHASW